MSDRRRFRELIERAGAEVVYMSGSATSMATLATPDTGREQFTELEARYADAGDD